MSRKMDVYSRLYRIIYITFYKSWKSDIPEWNAAILFPIMTVLNLAVLLAISGLAKYINTYFDFKFFLLALYGGLVLINYLFFIYNKRYKIYQESFDSLDKIQQKHIYLKGIFISIFGYSFPVILIIILLS
jgi:hypothetical protein